MITEPELLNERLERLAMVLDEIMPNCASLVRDALELLKEQEAVEHEWIYKHDNLWYCSRCGEFIYSSTDEDLAFHHVYCSRCGAKMKQEGR